MCNAVAVVARCAFTVVTFIITLTIVIALTGTMLWEEAVWANGCFGCAFIVAVASFVAFCAERKARVGNPVSNADGAFCLWIDECAFGQKLCVLLWVCKCDANFPVECSVVTGYKERKGRDLYLCWLGIVELKFWDECLKGFFAVVVWESGKEQEAFWS